MNLLVIQLFRLGDLLQCTPVLRGLKEKHPGCHITLLGRARFADFLEGHPDIDVLVRWDLNRLLLRYQQGEISLEQQLEELLRLVGSLPARPFDRIFNLSTDRLSALITHLIAQSQGGTPLVSGLTLTPDNRLLAQGAWARYLVLSSHFRSMNRYNVVDILAGMASLSGPRPLYWPSRPEEIPSAEAFWESAGVASHHILIGIQPGASKPEKRWPLDRFAAVARGLIEDPSVRIALFGSSEEKSLGDAIQNTIGERAVHLVGRTTLQELPARLRRCHLLLTNDTATMHFATAVGVPTLVVYYGQVYPWDAGPYGEGHHVLIPRISCYPCGAVAHCPRQMACLQNVPSAVVLAAVQRILRIGQATGDPPETTWPFTQTRLLRSHFHPEGHLAYEPVLPEPSTETMAESLPHIYARFWKATLNDQDLPSPCPSKLTAGQLRPSSQALLAKEFQNVADLARQGAETIQPMLEALLSQETSPGELRALAEALTPIDDRLAAITGAPTFLMADWIDRRESISTSTPLVQRLTIHHRLYQQLSTHALWFTQSLDPGCQLGGSCSPANTTPAKT
jgi:ADP-heptose:LPS heptosyltransferase